MKISFSDGEHGYASSSTVPPGHDVITIICQALATLYRSAHLMVLVLEPPRGHVASDASCQ